MVNPSGTIVIAFNGEVYNAFDFKPELEAAGFRFRSRTDTEVLLYLYEQYGLDGMLERLNGMFAIVIADLRSHEIHIARDHFGIKPLYWTAGRVERAVCVGSQGVSRASRLHGGDRRRRTSTSIWPSAMWPARRRC